MWSDRKTTKKGTTKQNGWSDQDDAFFGPTKPPPPPTNIPPIINNTRRTNKKESSSLSSSSQNNHQKKAPAASKGVRVSNWLSKATKNLVPPPPGRLNRQSPSLPSSSSCTNRKTITTNTTEASPHSRSTTYIPPPSSSNTATNTDDNNRLSLSRRLKQCLLTNLTPPSCQYCHSLCIDFYRYHPFFGASQRVCVSHDAASVLTCTACHRFQSKDHLHPPVGSSGCGGGDKIDDRLPLCDKCNTTAIRNDEELQKLYDTEVMEFLSVTYNLTLYRNRMASIPIRLVDKGEMQQVSSSVITMPHPHAGDTGGNSLFGLCVSSEWDFGGAFDFKFITKQHEKKRNTSTTTRGGAKWTMPLFGASSSSRGSNNVKIKGILIQRGLPSTLTTAILVHEAIHAWFALNPLRTGRIPSQIEEGCCQVVSHLYLCHIISKGGDGSSSSSGSKSISKAGDNNTDKQLKECYRWQIEVNTSEVYGEGYRKAAVAYKRMCENGGGLLTLLEYVCVHLDLPPPGA